MAQNDSCYAQGDSKHYVFGGDGLLCLEMMMDGCFNIKNIVFLWLKFFKRSARKKFFQKLLSCNDFNTKEKNCTQK